MSMACEGFGVTEIFLAYDSGDRERVRPVRDALNARGFDVLWEQEAPADVAWEAWVQKRLARCKCVVVLRSAASAHSNRMTHLAAVAKERGKLIVVRLEPRSTWQVQTGVGLDGLDLSNWNGSHDHPGWQELCRRIEGKLKTSLWVQRLMHESESDRTDWRARYETSAGRCKALNDELARERTERGLAQDKLAGLQAQLDADGKARIRLETRIIELEQRLEAAEDKRSEALDELRGELRQKAAELAEAQGALESEQAETASLRAELETSNTLHGELTSQIASHESMLAARETHIAGLEAGVTGRDSKIASLTADLAQRVAEVAGLGAAIKQRDAAIASLQATVKARDSAVAGLQATIGQRDAAVAGLKASLAERESAVAGLKATLKERDSAVSRLGASLAERDATVADLKVAVTQRDKYIADLEVGLSQRDSYIADLEASVSQRDTFIVELRTSIADRNAYMTDLEASIAQRDTHIADLKGQLAGLREPVRRSRTIALGA